MFRHFKILPEDSNAGRPPNSHNNSFEWSHLTSSCTVSWVRKELKKPFQPGKLIDHWVTPQKCALDPRQKEDKHTLSKHMLFLRHKLPSRFVNNDPLFIGLALFSMVTDIARYGYNRLLVLSVWLVKQVSLETSYKYDNSTFHGYIYKK